MMSTGSRMNAEARARTPPGRLRPIGSGTIGTPKRDASIAIGADDADVPGLVADAMLLTAALAAAAALLGALLTGTLFRAMGAPAELLPPGEYEIRVTGVAPDGRDRPVATYPFRRPS